MKEPETIKELRDIIFSFKCDINCKECPFVDIFQICDMLLEEFNNEE